jgi:hypothetical protein
MDIKIGRSAHTCAICEADFVHEQGIHSLVRLVESQFQREDYCGNCWGDEPCKGSYSTWNAQYYDPRVAEQQPEEIFSPLRQTFYGAVEDSTRQSIAIAYLAAQLLRRQKVFRLIKETKDPDTDASVILFNDRIGNRLIEVNDPNLSHEELDEARHLLMEQLTKCEAPEEEEVSDDENAENTEQTEVVSDSQENPDDTDTTPEVLTDEESNDTMEDTTDASTQETAQV